MVAVTAICDLFAPTDAEIAYPSMQDSAAKLSVDGESDASIVAKHMNLVKHLARKYSDGSNMEDLIQEGLTALIGARRTWREEAQFWTYAKRFVLGAMVRYATNETAEACSGDEAEGVNSLPSDNKPADDLIESAELSALVADGMIALTSEERRVTRLHFVDGISLHEIARTHGVSSKDTACRILNGAISKLRDRVKAGL